MESTAPAVFEIGFVLLLAAVAGWVARRAGLPAVLGYLATGLIVSPFTPGYTADRHQLQLFADVGVVLLLFEVGIEIDPLKLGRERGRLLLLAPLQTVLTAVLAGAAGVLVGLSLAGALLLGLCLALSSSVVVVNITRSRRRTTDAATDEALLGWSVIQDLVGVLLALAALIALGLEARSGSLAVALTVVYVAMVVAAAGLFPGLLRRLQQEHDLFLIFVVATALARFARLPGSPLEVAIGLGQIGEFSFVLATIGVAGKVIPTDLYTAILASVVLTIAASTVLVRFVRGRPSSQRA